MRKREWIRCSDPDRMIEQLWRLGDRPAYINTRPFHVFVLTAGERLWAEAGEVLRPTVELAWRLAEREASIDEVIGHGSTMQRIWDQATSDSNWQLARLVNVLALLFNSPGSAARTLVYPDQLTGDDGPRSRLLLPTELRRACWLIRELFGTQYGYLSVERSWLSSTVVALAEGIYADRAFDRLPILADALQDAGCEDTDILAHCRSDGSHVRGCWVVDLVLGRRDTIGSDRNAD